MPLRTERSASRAASIFCWSADMSSSLSVILFRRLTVLREGVMGDIKLLQVCYEGELTLPVSEAMRRLGAEPNSEQSGNVGLPEGGPADLRVRYLGIEVGDEARVLI